MCLARKTIAWIGAVVFLLCITLPTVAEAKTVKEWFCSLLGINPKVYEALTSPRGPMESAVGARLARFNLETGEESVLWDCEECWSPVTGSGVEILVLKKDKTDATKSSIWLVSPPAAPKILFTLSNVEMLVGKLNPNKIIVAIRDSNCKSPEEGYGLRLLDSSTGKLEPIPDSSEPCTLIQALLKPDQFRAGQFLTNSLRKQVDGTLRPRSLLIKKDPADLKTGNNLLTTRLDAQTDRFDPIWYGKESVVYLVNP